MDRFGDAQFPADLCRLVLRRTQQATMQTYRRSAKALVVVVVVVV